MKKLLLIFGLAWLAALRAAAQVSVEVVTEQDQFLPSESVPLAVKITNRSGQPLHLGADANWLTFDVESDDGFIVVKNGEVPVTGEFDMGSSQVATKRVDLKPYFNMTRPGRYHVVATLRIKDWKIELASPAKSFDVISGVKLWSQDSGWPCRRDDERPAGSAQILAGEGELSAIGDAIICGGERSVGVAGDSRGFARKDGFLQRAGAATGPPFQFAYLVAERGGGFSYAVVNPDGKVGNAGDLRLRHHAAAPEHER